MFRSPVAGSRTIFCRGQISMYNVFHAYSAHHREIGYVQGMMSIGGLALMYVPEEEAFWMLESILSKCINTCVFMGHVYVCTLRLLIAVC
jgi:hypothetical protein